MIERLCVLIISVIALWQLFAISYYPVIITIMITSSTSTSTSSWTCLKVHCRITIVVASSRNLTYSSLQLFIPPGQIRCVNKLISIQPKNHILGSLQIPILGSLHLGGLGYTWHLYWEPRQPGKKARFSRRLSSTVGLAPRGQFTIWMPAATQWLKKFMRSLVDLPQKKADNTTCLNQDL